ncbi:hypothetical protein BJV77DRAFT_108916 [Russula vinacea]|nr:hypothetical protein BJV77DRAFT_108916 [Russula vinacea]
MPHSIYIRLRRSGFLSIQSPHLCAVVYCPHWCMSFTLHRVNQLVCDKMLPPWLPRPKFTFPSWLPGFLSYLSLLVINAVLPLIAIITLENVATGLEITLVTCSLLASVILVAMLFYKVLMRSCVFNDIKRDKKALFCVTVLDICAAVGWAIRLDRKALFCTRPEHGSSCHTGLIVLGLILAWISIIICACFSNHSAIVPCSLSFDGSQL